jgi:hypothetical protein
MDILTDDQVTALFNKVYDNPKLIQHLPPEQAIEVLTRVEHRLDPVPKLRSYMSFDFNKSKDVIRVRRIYEHDKLIEIKQALELKAGIQPAEEKHPVRDKAFPSIYYAIKE